MLFSSVTFLYYFLPAVLLVYFAAPKKWKNGVLLLASLIFYFSGEPIYTLLLVFSSLSDYLLSLRIEKHRGQRAAKAALIASIVINLGMLGFFKYADFLLGNLNAIFGWSIPLLGLGLPIGISFFTFQTMSYTIDVYRGDAHAQKNLVSMATFVCLFPQLVAGPIVRYTDIASELDDRRSTLEGVSGGIRRFVIGLGKKVLIANVMGELCSSFRASGERNVLFYWMYAVAFCLQIYFDFSGYSDMAIGLGRIFGFTFPENFNYPYVSKSATEFWRRWHMTLGGWFRDYVYIPLGGNRVGRARWIFNILVVWTLTGLWHGAAWNFLLWGLYYGVLLILEKLWLQKLLDKLPAVFSHLYLLLAVVLGFVVFNATDMAEAFRYIGGMFGAGGIPLAGTEALYNLRSYAVVFLLGAVGSTPLVRSAALRLQERPAGRKLLAIAEPVAVGALLLVCTAFLVDGSFNPFLYFRF